MVVAAAAAAELDPDHLLKRVSATKKTRKMGTWVFERGLKLVMITVIAVQEPAVVADMGSPAG